MPPTRPEEALARQDPRRLISGALGSSEKTAAVHLRHVMAKLDVCSRSEVAVTTFATLSATPDLSNGAGVR